MNRARDLTEIPVPLEAVAGGSLTDVEYGNVISEHDSFVCDLSDNRYEGDEKEFKGRNA